MKKLLVFITVILAINVSAKERVKKEDACKRVVDKIMPACLAWCV